MPGIECVETQAAADYVTKARIREKKGEDVRERVFRAFASAQTPLLTLKAEGTSLEDVFMQLTQNDTLPKAFAEKIQWEEADQNAGNL